MRITCLKTQFCYFQNSKIATFETRMLPQNKAKSSSGLSLPYHVVFKLPHKSKVILFVILLALCYLDNAFRIMRKNFPFLSSVQVSFHCLHGSYFYEAFVGVH